MSFITREADYAIIVTETGRYGGVALNPYAIDLSLMDILTCMGFVNSINICVDQPEKCLLNPICNITTFFKKLQDDVEDKLKRAKLKDFLFDEEDLKNV